MIEVCPRCSTRLGPPLQSGRQVCASCGWSSDPPRSQRSSASPAVAKSSSAWWDVMLICGRIIRRSFVYCWQVIQLLLQRLRVSNKSVQPHQWATGLKKRLSTLEEAIPTSVDNLTQSWMNLEDAFTYLGGDLSNTRSNITTLDGTENLNFQRFSNLKSEREFRKLGLEANLLRREENKPWLRALF